MHYIVWFHRQLDEAKRNEVTTTSKDNVNDNDIDNTPKFQKMTGKNCTAICLLLMMFAFAYNHFSLSHCSLCIFSRRQQNSFKFVFLFYLSGMCNEYTVLQAMHKQNQMPVHLFWNFCTNQGNYLAEIQKLEGKKSDDWK